MVTGGRSGAVHIGTSGWHYEHWLGPFYPEGLRPRDFLSHYCRHFRTVEINSSFYRLPTEKTLATWRDETPAGFIFAVKASRFLTHLKKLQEPQRGLKPFLDRIRVLDGKLGPILFQLPPNWHFDGARLDAFLAVLPTVYRYTMEFRDPSWINREANQTLTEHGVAFCIYHLAGYQTPLEVTANFVYIRLHGPGGAYQGRYNSETLAGWAGRSPPGPGKAKRSSVISITMRPAMPPMTPDGSWK